LVEGIVTDTLDPVVGLTLIGDKDSRKEIRVVIDTGFSGYLYLSEEYVDDILVEYVFTDEFELANGETIIEDAFSGKIIFDDKLTEVFLIFTSSEDSLVGALLLKDFILTINYPQRTVTVLG